MSTGTPPPPNPAMAAAAPLPPEPQQPPLSQGARIINTFIAPRKTFEDIRRNASWWLPWFLSAIFLVVFAVVATQKLDMMHLAQQRVEQSKLAQTRMEQLSPEQRDKAMQLQATIAKVTLFVRPVFSLIFGLIAAAVLMAVFNFGFNAGIPFPRALAIVFYGSLPGIIRSILVCLALLFSADAANMDPDINPIATNPGFFMDPQGNKFLYALVSGFDVIAIWIAVLIGLGFAVCSTNRKLTTGTGITVMLVVYGILVLIGAGLRSAF